MTKSQYFQEDKNETPRRYVISLDVSIYNSEVRHYSVINAKVIKRCSYRRQEEISIFSTESCWTADTELPICGMRERLSKRTIRLASAKTSIKRYIRGFPGHKPRRVESSGIKAFGEPISTHRGQFPYERSLKLVKI